MHLQELYTIPVFQGLEAKEIASLEGVLSEKTLGPDELLFDQGDKAWACFIVLSGEIHVELPPDKSGGTVKNLATLGHGQVLGEICLIDGGRRSARCRAGNEGARLAQLARPEFDLIFNSGSRLAFRLVDLISDQLVQRLRNTTQLLQASIGTWADRAP